MRRQAEQELLAALPSGKRPDDERVTELSGIGAGSVASHGAIISREFGIPCVINTGDGTGALRTGDVVRVDGTAGTVTVLTPA